MHLHMYSHYNMSKTTKLFYMPWTSVSYAALPSQMTLPPEVQSHHLSSSINKYHYVNYYSKFSVFLELQHAEEIDNR